MLIRCKNCQAIKDWRKERHERLVKQTCDKCGGKYTMLDCLKQKCEFLQFRECKDKQGYCLKRKEGRL